MNFRLVFKLTGKVLLVESCAMVLPLLVGFFYGDNPMPFLATIPLTTTFSPGRAFSPWPLSGC